MAVVGAHLESTPMAAMYAQRGEVEEASEREAMGSGRGTSGSGKGRGDSSGESMGGSGSLFGVPRHYDLASDQANWSGVYGEEWEWASQHSRWDRRSNENWSWESNDGASSWGAYAGGHGNWEWVRPRDRWHEWHRDEHRERWGESHGDDSRRRDGDGDGRALRGRGAGLPVSSLSEDPKETGREASPFSPPGARDVTGALPNGEIPGVGQNKEKTVAGDHKGKISSSYPPIFRAKPGESFREWQRSVGFWLGGEANTLPAELVGPRIMVQLRDRAGQLVHHLSNADVNCANGMKLIMETLEKSPIIRQLDRHKVDQHRKKLMQLRRLPGESIESYVTRGSIYRTQLQALDKEMQMGECFYTGHLMDNAKLTRKDKVMIKTKAGTDYEEDITNAMIDLAPELEGEGGFPIGTSEPNAAARQGDEYLVQRSETNRYKKDTMAMEHDGPTWDDPLEVVDEENLLDEEGDPPELAQAANEAYAMHHKAKQKIMEIRKLRQYFRKPDPEERKKILAEKMKTAPCHRCGELGHWSRECPQKVNGTGVAATSRGGSGRSSVEEEWAAFVAMCHKDGGDVPASSGRYKVRAAHAVCVNGVGKRGRPAQISKLVPHTTLWCQEELHLHVILDLGCVKSVVGLAWMKGLVDEWKQKGRWFRVFPDNEVFQFGNGAHLTSRYCVHFEAVLATRHVVLAMSVVNGNCPPLLSRHACSQLGLHIDCGNHQLSSTKLNVKGYGMKQARNGHYIVPISRFEEGEVSEVQKDFRVPAGTEAFIVPLMHTQMPKRLYTEIDNPSSSSAVELGHGDSRAWEAHYGEGEGEEDRSSSGVHRPADVQDMRGGRTSTTRVSNVVGEGGLRREGDDRRLRGSREGEEGFPASAGSEAEPVPRLSREGRDVFLGLGSGLTAGIINGGGEDDRQEAREGSCRQDQEADPSGIDRTGGRLSKSEPRVVSGSEHQHGLLGGIEDEDVPMEEVTMATEGQASRGEGPRLALEEESTLVGDADGKGSCGPLGPLRSDEAEDEGSGSVGVDVTSQALLRRGEVQRLKRGVRQGMAVAEALVQVAHKEERFVVMEIFAGTATLSGVAHSAEFPHWCATPPVDILYGYDLKTKEDQRKVLKMWEEYEPDLLTISMPCGPWCQWMNLCDPEVVAEKRTEDMPLWRFARLMWDKQVRAGRLAMSGNPLGSEGLKLTFMEGRPRLHRAKVAQCMLGLKDVISGKPHRKLTALDASTPEFQERLERGAQCQHAPHEHQPIEGKVYYQGQWVNRSTLAGAWPKKLCRHILKAAEECLREVQPVEILALHEESAPGEAWEIGVVGSSQVPEESLRQTMGELGGAADRYGYITFEGQGQQTPRRIRSAVAHLHSALGHIANDRLVRMLMISGAGEQILMAARNLRCQVCAMVQPPRDVPQASYKKPSTFNERVSGDTFYVWDVKGVKFAVVHFLDELTDYHVSDCSPTMDSAFASGVLRDQWYGVFGPPDLLVTDMGKEFAGTIDTLNEIMGVKHDVIPDGAKWRLGHAERHGSILKIMMMKMVKALNLQGLDDMRMAATAACAAKNRLCNHGGISPLQAVTGRNALLPASLMTQICSGKMKFVVNQELSREESLQRADRIRTGALESFHWLDAHQTLRRALSTKSRPPRLEMIKEGATVYIYDPPAKRRGLSRRIQDNISWEGPGTVVCVEREKTVPSKIWVRLKGRVKAVPLEKVRLATVEELVSGHFIKEALDEVQKELTSGRMRVEEIPAGDVPEEDRLEVEEQNVLEDGTESDSSVGTQEGQPEDEQELGEDKETARMRFEKRLLTDVPLSFRPPPEAGESASSSMLEDPSKMPFAKKQRLFESLAKELGPPTAMQEARLRGQLEDAFAKLKTVRKSLKAVRPKAKAEPKAAHKRRAVAAVSNKAVDVMVALEIRRREAEGEEYIDAEDGRGVEADGPEDVGDPRQGEPFNVFSDKEIPRKVSVIDAKGDNDLRKLLEEMDRNEAEYGHDVTEILWQDVLWTRPSTEAMEAMVLQRSTDRSREDQKFLDASQLITGKDRVELNWKQLEDGWKKAFVPPILKAFKVYFDHEAIQGVPLGQWVEPQRILPSRLVLTITRVRRSWRMRC